MSRRNRPSPAPPLHLEIVTTDHPLRAQVLRLAPLPEQERFCARASQTLPRANDDPGRTPFAVVATGPDGIARAVGFGVLDRSGYLAELVDAPERAVLLRGFYVAADAQGRGIGSRAARAVRELAGTLQGVEVVVLTVNVLNPAAVTAYLRGGFVDTGIRYLGGSEGPQHLLVAGVLTPPSGAGQRQVHEEAEVGGEPDGS